MNDTTISGIASGLGGGIGIVRISGENALSIVGKLFRTKSSINKNDKWEEDYFKKKSSHTIHYGFIMDGDEIVDEVVVLLMKAPRSYTMEDVIEIDSHGGPFVVQKILELTLKAGAVLAEPGEFTKRAFLNGRIDLSQAEAVMEIISSENNFALESAVKQLEGTVSRYIEDIRKKILHDMSFIEAALDDPEHYELDDFREELAVHVHDEIQVLQDLLSRFHNGRMKSEGIDTVIVGKPNAGKSSLMNLLLDEERAIVTDIAGTTRDALQETVHLGNIMLKLTDTAGIRQTDDVVENMGVEKAVNYLEQADFILFVVDSSEKLEDSDEEIIRLLQGKRGVILFNKTDLPSKITIEDIVNKLDWHCILFSNETRDGLEELERYIETSFLNGDISFNDQIYLTSVRQKKAVDSALESLQKVADAIDVGMSEDFLTIDLMDAYRGLGLINGDTASEDLVNKIFSEFCMGK